MKTIPWTDGSEEPVSEVLAEFLERAKNLKSIIINPTNATAPAEPPNIAARTFDISCGFFPSPLMLFYSITTIHTIIH